MEHILKPTLLSLPLLRCTALRQVFHDPQHWARAVSTSTPVRICEPLKPSGPFYNESAVLQLGSLHIVATQGSPVTLATEEHPFAQLLIPYGGNGFWLLERQTYPNPVGESVLYLPPAPLRLENTMTSGVSLNLNPTALIQTALTMAGPEHLSPQQLAIFQQPKRLTLRDPRSARLIHGLYTALLTLDQVMGTTGADAKQLRFDDLLMRMVVLLLLPELQQDDPSHGDQAGSLAARRKLEALVEWIEANLEMPIGISDLEAHAHWSRRTLQTIFREAYGCTPMQWVRRRRVQKAMQRLERPQKEDTVTSIGQSVGFLSPATFHREFRRQFGCSPSSVLRR